MDVSTQCLTCKRPAHPGKTCWEMDAAERKVEETESGKILGIDRRTIPGPGSVWRRTDIIVVLVSGAIDDYAAYLAAGSDPEFAKQHGDKISFEEACARFPGGQLKRERYRD